MGEILGLGVTHYPSFVKKVPGPSSLLKLLEDPGLPEHYRTPEGWPEAMRAEWGSDNGRTIAVQHRDAVIEAVRGARAVLDEFKPDFLVVWGDDQYENFRADVIPPFCVLAYDSFEVRPWSEDRPPNLWDEGADYTLRVPGHRAGAKALTSSLIENGFDVAYAYQPLHTLLGHAFLHTVLYLDWDRVGFPYAIVPFTVNCYGRRIVAMKGYMESLAQPVDEDSLDPPSPSPARCFDLGAACARAMKASPWRVALVASSSWSHAFLTRKSSYLYPDTPADHVLFDALRNGNYDVWRSTPLAAVEDSGQHEMLNWFCLAGAMAELGRRPNTAEFFASDVMNSNKVIATFTP